MGKASIGRRWLLAGALLLAGVVLICTLPLPIAPLGIALIIGGHLALWVRGQTNAPGGATPRHEEMWAPVEEEWLDRVEELERRAERWDTTPFDVTNVAGFLAFWILLSAIAAGAAVTARWLGFDPAWRMALGSTALLLPLWFNGIRTTWNPSELRKKGEALASALAAVKGEGGTDFDPVPMLALREGKQGKYPVDAKLMLRPATDDGSGFLGVQVQVAMNSVQGTDYPYLYAVVLGRGDFRLPESEKLPPAPTEGRTLVFENGSDGEVSYLVIRQHASRSGGWHTEEDAIRRIVLHALAVARVAWEENRP